VLGPGVERDGVYVGRLVQVGGGAGVRELGLQVDVVQDGERAQIAVVGQPLVRRRRVGIVELIQVEVGRLAGRPGTEKAVRRGAADLEVAPVSISAAAARTAARGASVTGGRSGRGSVGSGPELGTLKSVQNGLASAG
jgi:hypothetical protein